LINDISVERLIQNLQTCGGTVLAGGTKTYLKEYNKLFISPTIILNPSPDSKLCKEEIFGPILYLVTYNNFDEVVKQINEKDKPLAVYYMGNP
jgi:acyl-CoA reductase-like NAD-dependent aldehyde dehydrogenase